MYFFSHPNKPLREHLRAVGELMEKDRLEIFPEKFLYYVGLCHDFGKYTTYFQEYLNGKRDPNNLHHHSQLSAYFGAWFLKEKFGDKWAFIGFLSILNHHGSLNKYLEPDKPKFKRWFEDLQAKSDIIYDELGIDIKGFLKTDVEKLAKDLKRFAIREVENKKELENFFLVAYTFSTLIYADKRDAGNVQSVERREIPADIVDRYIKQFPNEGINQKRFEFYRDVMRVLDNYKGEKFIFVNAPTGIGKTLANLSLALKLKERFYTGKPRIIYVLPFVSIIDQTYEVFYKLFSQYIKDFRGNEEAYLLKHHHLADLRYRSYGEETPIDEALLLTEGWESEVIITTFVQFFETVIGRSNSMLKKFHNLTGSIVILDEIQNIDAKWWKLIEEGLKKLSEIFGNVFIISTATRPLIFLGEKHINATDYKKFAFNRTCIRYKNDVRNLEELKNLVLNSLDGKNSVMVVLNTVNSSIEFYNMIKYKAQSLGFKTFYLSTNVIPKHRLKRLEGIKKSLENGENVLLVSTQVVEAGVDVDFEMVFRDLGPLDSIVQVAGRCNRNSKRGLGEVVVVKLEDDNGILYSSRVYGAILTQSTERVLRGEICEREYFEIVEEYFKVVSEKRSQEDSEEILKAMAKLNYNNLDKFKIVQEEPNMVDVFIQVDEEGKRVFEEFVEKVLKCEDRLESYKNFLLLRKDLRNYLVSIPEKYAKNVHQKDDLRFVPLEELQNYYDFETGFKRDVKGYDVW
ncbi:MAG: CRISPR-associated helicase Cas3' [candidate division WOR-3 bacterium]